MCIVNKWSVAAGTHHDSQTIVQQKLCQLARSDSNLVFSGSYILGLAGLDIGVRMNGQFMWR
jgi:hypothetical protein